MSVIDWLLDSDPAIRWQVMRDLTDAPAEAVAAERALVAREGWGKGLLEKQHPVHQWSDGSKRSYLQTPDGSACYTLQFLCDMGLEPASAEARRAIEFIRQNVTHYEGGKPYFEGETEPCINGRVLGQGAYFGVPNTGLLERLLSEQLPDGGWNCEAPKSRRASFHTTICVLEGLLTYERASGARPLPVGGADARIPAHTSPQQAVGHPYDARVREARKRGEEYLLERRLFRSLSSGDVLDPEWSLFSYPVGWHYDVLRGLDYLRSANATPDDRVGEAIDLVEKNRGGNGRWPLMKRHSDIIPFDMGEEVGQPSRWNTLRALRVLKWAGRGTG